MVDTTSTLDIGGLCGTRGAAGVPPPPGTDAPPPGVGAPLESPPPVGGTPGGTIGAVTLGFIFIGGRCGSIRVPFRRTSKCKCGPVLLPVLPTSAICCPATTLCPRLHLLRELCAYSDTKPPPWSIITVFPKPPCHPDAVTVPGRLATIRAPLGAAISIPP